MANAGETFEPRADRASGVHRICFPSEMLVMALHDLRSPLWTLKLGLELLGTTQGIAPDCRRRTLDRLARSVERMGELLGGLTTALELHEGDLPLQLEEVELREVADEVVHSLEARAERLSCTIAVVSPEPVRGLWDSLRLWQVVHNLVSNALQYGKGSVRVAVWQDDDRAYLSVEDDGPGLEPWEQARVFERNWRGARAAESSAGHGLGLWIVRRITRALGGDVDVESAHGRGARFVVRLPKRL